MLTEYDAETLDVDIVFLAQESGFAMENAPELIKRTRVIDLSADFRLKDLEIFRAAYGKEHTAPATEAVYGLPELVGREMIAKANLVANPGCYPTSALLGLMPLVNAGIVNGVPVIDAKSGVSGAGRSRQETDYLFSELTGSFKSYGVTGHRHVPEIEQMAGRPVRFTPHLIAAARGLQSTIHAPVSVISIEDLTELYRKAYAGQRFVSIVDTPPSTKQVCGSNRCDIAVYLDARTGHAVIISVLDNLIKGAAGQAIQNMNIMLGLPEETGLPIHGVWP